MIPRCAVCDTALDPYGQDTRCDRCSEPCPTCGGDVMLCKHPLQLVEVEVGTDPKTGWPRIAA